LTCRLVRFNRDWRDDVILRGVPHGYQPGEKSWQIPISLAQIALGGYLFLVQAFRLEVVDWILLSALTHPSLMVRDPTW
jgi:hypothetical protein